MMFKLIWIAFVCAVGAAQTVGIIVGGWSTADAKSRSVQNAAAFAVRVEFPKARMTYRVSSAMKQIVAGTNYDIMVAITLTKSSNCTMHRYVVYEKLDQTFQMTKMESLTKKCPK